MDSSELLALSRTKLGDDERPYIWPDVLLWHYIDAAQEQLCRWTEGIEDAATPELRLSIVPDKEWYDIDPRVLKIRSATRQGSGQEMLVIPMERTANYNIVFDGHRGPVRALVLGARRGAARAWPFPSEALKVDLAVFRLPYETISGPNQEFEIDPQHHAALFMWVAHLAYNEPDKDVYDPTKSANYREMFQRYCIEATREQTRRRHPAGTTTYGGL